MEMKDWISLAFSIGTPVVLFLIAYIRMQSKFESHEQADQKNFDMLTKYSGEFFDRITKLEITGSEKAESLRNLTSQFHEIRNELSEIKSILLRNYKK